MASHEFQDQLTQFLPKMRVWALALTRNGAAADDLVQDVALTGCGKILENRGIS